MCAGRICSVHNPSNHEMINWPQEWDGYSRLMVRQCPHGLYHPDPDSVTYLIDTGNAYLTSRLLHTCDNCCVYVSVGPGNVTVTGAEFARMKAQGIELLRQRAVLVERLEDTLYNMQVMRSNSMTTPEVFGALVRERRLDRGLTINGLAALCVGLQPRRISTIEKGAPGMIFREMVTLCTVLNLGMWVGDVAPGSALSGAGQADEPDLD